MEFPRLLEFLETRIPPPAVMLLCAAGAYVSAQQWPLESEIRLWVQVAAYPVVFLGLLLNLLPKLQFKRAGTTVNPLAPERAQHLVTTGIYRYTRNPMYLGHALILLGWTLWLQHPLGLLWVVVYVLWVTRLQILPEEQILARRFPEDFQAFKQRARRWL